MLVFIGSKLAYFALPKTGTTAVEKRLAPLACMSLQKNPLKHIDFQFYQENVVPMLGSLGVNTRLDTVCVMRDPLDFLGSWYRYRSRPQIRSRDTSTSGIEFSEFVEAVLEPTPPPYAQFRRQTTYMENSHGEIGLDIIFRYGDPGLANFFSHRLGRSIVFEKSNVSPKRKLNLSAGLRARLESEWEREFKVFEDVAKTVSLETYPSWQKGSSDSIARRIRRLIKI